MNRITNWAENKTPRKFLKTWWEEINLKAHFLALVVHVGHNFSLQKFLILGQMVVLWSMKIGCLFKLNDLHFHFKFLSLFLALWTAKIQWSCILLMYWGQGAINPSRTCRDKAKPCWVVQNTPKTTDLLFGQWLLPMSLHITSKVSSCHSTSFAVNTLKALLHTLN